MLIFDTDAFNSFVLYSTQSTRTQEGTDTFVQPLGRVLVCDRHGSFDADREITVAVARSREGTNDGVHRDPTWPNGAARGLIRSYRASSQLHPLTHTTSILAPPDPTDLLS